MSLSSEIFEQPAVLTRLLASGRQPMEKVAEAILARDVDYIFVAARGTSDNAGRYASYLWGAFNHLPVALATPSLFTYYGAPPRLRNALVMGVSQSGQSPDIVSVITEGRAQGALTLAVVNAPESPMARQAELVVDVLAGVEAAVAATKSYTAELMAIAMLSCAMDSEHPERWDDLAKVPAWVAQTLALDSEIARMAQRYCFMERCVVLGRGFNYATAFEWSLKLKELTYLVAEPYSSADFQHGPIAMVEHGFPVLAVVPQGKVYGTLIEMLKALRDNQHAELVIISDEPEALQLAQSPLPLPVGIPEWLTPIVGIVAGQLFAYHLTRAKGLDTEKPRSIHKVTETH